MASPSHKPSAKNKKHTPQASSISQTEPVSPTDVNDSEPAYIKELQKSLRNAVKKLNATAKIDAILAEHPGKSLDDLVEEKKINADQKAQALKKPSLQAAVTQIEEQLGHYKQIAAQYEEKIAKQKEALDQQKAALDKIHQEELAAVRANALADATESNSRLLREKLLEVAKFLCAAANMRRAGDETPEGVAFEAVLYQVYAGNQDAVTSMVKLIEGADEQIQGLEGETLDLTYGNVKQIFNRNASIEEPEQYANASASEKSPTSDPTIANAGLTELQDTSVSAEVAAQAETTTSQPDQLAPPSQTSTTTGANPAADSTSMTSASAGMNDSWTEVPRDPAETETGLQATPANTETNAAADIGAKGNSSRRGRHGRGRGDGSRRGRGGGESRGGDRPRGRRGGKRGGANGVSADGQ